jgi:Ca2+-binding RTX toxin-like protein
MTRLLLVCLLACGVLAGPAHATLLIRSDATNGLLIQDKNGIGDRVVVSAATVGGAPVYLIENRNPGDVFKFDIQANRNQCATNDKATCKRFDGRVNVTLVGGDDAISLSASGATSVSANLGTGNDDYTGSGGADNVFGGSGDDTVRGNGGADDLSVGPGIDSVEGGAGNDRLGSLNGARITRGNVDGGPGNDVIELFTLEQGDDRTFIGGREGDDTITVEGDGRESVSGGPGVDTVATSAGDDFINVNDDETVAARDTVRCGFDHDRVLADLRDVVDATSNVGGGTCEEVDRGAIEETPNVRIAARRLKVADDGTVRVRLRCPAGVKKLGCEGTLSLGLRSGKGPTARERYAIKARRAGTVELRLARAVRRRLPAEGVLVSLEEGRDGPKETVRTPRLVT